MRFGVCLPFEKISLLPEGYLDYAELSLMQISKASKVELEKARAELASLGIKAERSNGFCPAEVRLCGENYDPSALREYSKRAISTAKEYFGTELFVVGSSKSRSIGPSVDVSKAMSELEEAYGIMGDVAREYNSLITVEHLNSKECNTLVKAKESAEFIRRVDHPNCKLMIDFYHFSYEKEDLSVILENSDIIKHFHVADPLTRNIPSPSYEFDYSPLKAALNKIGYNNTMSVESHWGDDYASDVRTAISYLRSIFS